MSSYKLEYKLKQQTPLIHFQWDQEGATLRATEVKPKLDRFIINKMGGKDNIPLEWLIDKDKNALNYKMRISVSDGEKPVLSTSLEDALKRKEENEIYNKHKDEKDRNGKFKYKEKRGDKYIVCKDYKNKIKNDYPDEFKNAEKNYKESLKLKGTDKSNPINGMYFGNQGTKREDLDKYKETVFYENDIDLTITCFIPLLKDKIDEFIAEFFAITNFGTRQSKGFGGFLLYKKVDKNWVAPVSEENIVNFLIDNGYQLFYVEKLNDDQIPMNVAKSIYCCMKTGVNLNKKRVKGFLLYNFLYYNEEAHPEFIGYRSDKSLMTEKLIYKSDSEHKKYLFVRALLGLTDVYDFRDRGKKVNIKCQDKDKDGNILVERFPSPVTIKIVGKEVVFLFDSKLFKEIQGHSFTFECDGKSETISVPEIEDVQKFTEKLIDDYVNYHNMKDEGYEGDEYLPVHINEVAGYKNTYSEITRERRKS